MRPRPALIRLIAVLLLLQWGTAFGQCLRLGAPAAAALTIEICTAEGLRHVTLPGEPAGDADGHGAVPLCPACLGPAAAGLAAPVSAPAAPVQYAQAVDPPPPTAPPLPRPAPSPSCGPRAPPTS